jgi:hypothetical protein
MTVYFVSGHLDLTPMEFQISYVPKLEAALNVGGHFVVGDARGADSMAQEWLKAHNAPTTVYHMFEAPRINAGHQMRGGFFNDDERDAAMTAASQVDIAWVRPGREKSGTAKNIKRRSL